jgi:two-component system response regulator AlgR
MSRLRVLIADDEPLAVERLQILCARLDTVQLVGTAADGEAALRMVEALDPDVLLLDIAMPGLDGVAVARALAGARTRVVFVTAFDAHAVAAFDLGVADYVLKPVAADRLKLALERAGAQRQAPPERDFWVPARGELVRVAANDIERVEAERDYMRLWVGTRSWLLHATMDEVEGRLDPDRFVRVHRSTILRRDTIKGLRHEGGGAWSALDAEGRAWRIGRSHLDAVRAMVRE